MAVTPTKTGVQFSILLHKLLARAEGECLKHVLRYRIALGGDEMGRHAPGILCPMPLAAVDRDSLILCHKSACH